jgi:hypothetical protein
MPLGPERDRELKLVGALARGNLHWFVRQLIGGTSYNDEAWIKDKIQNGEMLERSHFLSYMRKLNEDNFS